ncbi:Uncharacterized protein DAT39_011925 [Clarias magur]|uniref:Uncharacterized protein n=1 Tax=Clarias magur TaxID=1594786 RepID=A0A8J4U456_CLAMG|nr:Uncharacterized protein DAT39_011925 [Clarias magur]
MFPLQQEPIYHQKLCRAHPGDLPEHNSHYDQRADAFMNVNGDDDNGDAGLCRNKWHSVSRSTSGTQVTQSLGGRKVGFESSQRGQLRRGLLSGSVIRRRPDYESAFWAQWVLVRRIGDDRQTDTEKINTCCYLLPEKYLEITKPMERFAKVLKHLRASIILELTIQTE